MLNGYIPGLRYNIKGSVATSRAMPTPFCLSIMKLVSFGSSGFIYTRVHNNCMGAGPFVSSREVVLYT